MNRLHVLYVAVGVAVASGELAAQGTRPLDPLTPAELELTRQLVRADSQVRRLIGDRRNILTSISFVPVKIETADTAAPQREPTPVRTAMVTFYIYDGDFGVRAFVDLAKRTVGAVERVEEEPIPMAPEEIATAKRLALADSALRTRLGPRPETLRVEWLGIRAADDRDPCYHRRCVQLLFRRGRAFLTRPTVIVDLTRGTVRTEEP